MNDDRLDKYNGWETREEDGGIEKGKNRGKETSNTKRGWKGREMTTGRTN